MEKVIIIGSGPAGYTAALYASRANLNPLLIDGPQPGGQLTTTTEVENFPGFPEGIQGPQLMENMKQQAAAVGTRYKTGFVTKVDLSKRPFKLWVDEKEQWWKPRPSSYARGLRLNTAGYPGKWNWSAMGFQLAPPVMAFSLKTRKSPSSVAGIRPWKRPIF